MPRADWPKAKEERRYFLCCWKCKEHREVMRDDCIGFLINEWPACCGYTLTLDIRRRAKARGKTKGN